MDSPALQRLFDGDGFSFDRTAGFVYSKKEAHGTAVGASNKQRARLVLVVPSPFREHRCGKITEVVSATLD